MTQIGRSSMKNQDANPIADKIMEYLYDYMIFAPQFFDTESGEPTKQTPNDDKRPKIFDASKYVKRAYSKGICKCKRFIEN